MKLLLQLECGVYDLLEPISNNKNKAKRNVKKLKKNDLDNLLKKY